MNRATARIAIDALSAAGTRAIFGVPGGGGNLDLIEAAGDAGVRLVLTATETGAAIAAIGHAQVSGSVGACLTTLGPGASSVVNGVACAYLDRTPLVVFSDSGDERYEHQRIDQRALFAPITKASYRLTEDAAEGVMATALDVATSGRPGPVHIECPGGSSGPAKTTSEVVLMNKNTTSEVVLHGANKPALLLGLGARQPDDAAAIRAFCERHRVPAMVTYMAKGVVPDHHPWFAGVFTNGAVERPLLDKADLLVGVGLDPVELLPRAWPFTVPIVYVGRWAVDADHVPFASQHVGSIAEGLQHLGETMQTSEWTPGDLEASRTAQRGAVAQPVPGLAPHQVVDSLAGRLTSSSRVTVDAGAHMFPATTLWPTFAPNDLLISNGLSTMGFAIPAAIGAAIADSSRRVIALTGDGGALMCLGELRTIVRERLDVIVVVFNDASLSLIEIKQQARLLQPAGVDLGDVAWSTIGSALGLRSWSCQTVDDLDQAIAAAAEQHGPGLIEVKIDRSGYSSMLKAVRG